MADHRRITWTRRALTRARRALASTRKATTAFTVATIGFLGGALEDGHITTTEVIAALGVGLTALATVYGVTNADA